MENDEVVERYPLTPLQEGMLFQHVYSRRPGVDLLHIIVEIHHELNVDALERAWRQVMEHHAALRTGIHHEDVKEAVQEVHRNLSVPIDIENLTTLSDVEQQRVIEGYERADRLRGFANLSAPLMRVKIFELGPERFRMLLSIHHIVVDGRACQLILQEVFACYEAQREGRAIPLRRSRPFREYVEQMKSLEAQLPEAKEFWREKLKGFSSPTQVFTDVAQDQEAFRTEQCMWLPAEVSRRARAWMRSSGLTLNTLMQGVWAMLLSRYSGEEDIVFGATKTTRRTLPGGEAIVGPLIATIPVRIQVRREARVGEWLKELRREWVSSREFDWASLAVIQQTSEVPLTAKLFDTLVVFEEGNFDDGLKASGSGWRKRSARLISADTNYALTLMAYGGEEMEVRICYDERQFSRATVERMLGHYRVLLEAIVKDAERRIGELPLLGEEEREQIVVKWNATEREYARASCVHELFERQAERTPERVAVVSGGEPMTYGELNAQANRLAHYLQRRGAGVGSRVGLYVERGLGMMVALLGVLKSGGAYVPLDAGYPEERVRATLQEAEVSLLVTEDALAGQLPGYEGEVVSLEAAQIAGESGANPEGGATAGDIAYVIFTSGSTGKPKGVEVGHRGVVNLLEWMGGELQMGEGDVFPALASYGFDMSVPELYLGLVSGGRVVIAPGGMGGDGEELAKFLKRHGATVVQATPTTWGLLLEAGYTGKGLKRCIGAEALPRGLFERLMEAGEGTALYNFYGPTETTVWSTYQRFTSIEEEVVIGRPLGNTQIYILDRNLSPVPVGVSGEIHIGGEGVARGYLKRPELTGEKFIGNPFSDDPKARLYKTGDLGKYLPDGRIDYLGRIDQQVKIRGYRIELGEVEAVLAQHGSVGECVVVAREDHPGDKRLVGYIVPNADHTFDAAELRAHVKGKLPEYMVPSALVELPQMPLTANGKVDRKALPAPEYQRQSTRDQEAAGSPAEELIAGIWEEVLKLAQVGATDNFFELGGHSLLATQVVSRIRQAMHVELPLKALFEDPTVAELARRVEQLQREQAGLVAPPLVRVSREKPLPLSFAQQRLWFVNKLDPTNSFYNLPFALKLTGELNAEALRKSLQEIVGRHEALRTSFAEVEGEVVQVIAPAASFGGFEVSVVDISELPREEREAEARREAQRESLLPFDLRRSPLFRAKLLRLSGAEHVLILNMHHIISDAWSRGVLMVELAALYKAFVADEASPLPELPIQYGDYAVWQREWLRGEVLERQLAYWREQLRGAQPVLPLVTDYPRPQVQSFGGAVHGLNLPAAAIQPVKELSRSEGATLFMALLAVFQILLSRLSGEDQVVVGTDLANRVSVEMEKLIGFFVNVLPMRCDLSGDPVFRDVLRQTREVALAAYAHQDIPFDKLVQEISPERTLSHNPVVQVLFVMLNTPEREIHLPGLRVEPFEFALTRSKFDLVVFVRERDGGLATEWLYSTDLFAAETVQRMAENFAILLADAVERPNARIGSLEHRTEKERRGLESARLQHLESKNTQLKSSRRKAIGLG